MIDSSTFFERYKHAAQTRDKEAMMALYRRDTELFDMWNAYHLRGIDNIRSMVNQWFDSIGDERLEVDFSEVQLKQDHNIAFAYAFVHFRAMDAAGNVLRQMKNRMTLCFVKEGVSWRVSHQHTSIPISTQNMQGIFE